jgi:hypothetical protein
VSFVSSLTFVPFVVNFYGFFKKKIYREALNWSLALMGAVSFSFFPLKKEKIQVDSRKMIH